MKFKLTEIHTLKTKPYEGPVYDLTVANDESYNIDGIVVHNSACSTRIKTGCGVPQLSAIADCAKCSKPIIADGGIRTPGDVCKALAAGASMVMLGGMLAGTDETPGEIQYKYYDPPDGPYAQMKGREPFKSFRGMASKEANEDQFGTMADWKTAEGVSTMVPCKGPVENVIKDIMGGLRSCMTYLGAGTIGEMRSRAEFIEITSAGVLESLPHAKSRES